MNDPARDDGSYHAARRNVNGCTPAAAGIFRLIACQAGPLLFSL